MFSNWRVLWSSGVVLGVAATACAGVTLSMPKAKVYTFNHPISRKPCHNDNECSMQKCVKDWGELQGLCTQAVDEHGAPTFLEHDPTSSEVGDGNCSDDSECPSGAKCEKKPLAPRGNCFR